ncbi:MAG: hypothetical protein EZS28_003744 [Streblomastix strix]|uniref:Uncharacterized protein n=1 Tax=Streblomastix strix TaxID=222440 RepID=A0A5J4X0S5_9EUKA|nr:MAG: hypothetical protein EZS28_003744 [Streblomastix strix]
MVQTCQVNWTIIIPANTLAIQLNETNIEDGEFNRRINFNGQDDSQAAVAKSMTQAEQNYYGKTADGDEESERLRFWFGFSTAFGPFHQFHLMRDATALWGTSIYINEQAAICSNSLSDLCTSNSVSVSPLENIIAGKRHCGIFIYIPLSDIDLKSATTPWYFKIAFDITFSGVLDLNQLNPIFNSFPDLMVVWLNKQDTVQILHLAYHMIPPEKPDIIYLLKESTEDEIFNYKKLNVRIVNIQNAAAADRGPQNFPYSYEALTQTVTGVMFDCFVDQDVVSAPSDLYHSLTFENLNCSDKGGGLYGRGDVNVFTTSTLFEGTKASKTLYPNKYMSYFKWQLDQRSIRQLRFKQNPTKASITPMLHYLYDAVMRITFDNNPDPQVLNIDVIGELGGSTINAS